MNKNRKKIVILVVVLIIFTLFFSVYIIYDKVLNKKIKNDEEISENVINYLYDMLGIPSDNLKYGNHTLNMYISKTDYKKYAEKIISHYAHTEEGQRLFKIINDDLNIPECEQFSVCTSITKENAEKILKAYNLDGKAEDYFENNSLLEGGFLYKISREYSMGMSIEIEHDIDSRYVNNTQNIIIKDKQKIETFNEMSGKSINKQIVYYEFRKDNNDNYYLYSVNVK